MGQLIQLRQNPGASIDPLTVEVATALWRLGGVADRDAIAASVAWARGRPHGFSAEECEALYAALATSVAMRAAMSLPAMLHQPAGPEGGRWALTDLANAVLGPLPALH